MKLKSLLSLLTLVSLSTLPLHAHFLEVRSESPVLEKGKEKAVTIAFGHPSQKKLLKFDQPTKVELIGPKGSTDLTKKVTKGKEAETYTVSFTPDAVGDYTLVVTGAPYYEKDESQYIQQTAKMTMNLGAEEGTWHKPVGLPVEIVPLARPYALVEGSTFTGQVMINKQPAANTKVEVTLAHCCDPYEIPTALHDTQTIYTDANGVFTVAMPLSGWWGFAAISEAGKKMKSPEGKDVPVEADGVIWVFTDLLKKK